jgi:hypothetical protein
VRPPPLKMTDSAFKSFGKICIFLQPQSGGWKNKLNFVKKQKILEEGKQRVAQIVMGLKSIAGKIFNMNKFQRNWIILNILAKKMDILVLPLFWGKNDL